MKGITGWLLPLLALAGCGKQEDPALSTQLDALRKDVRLLREDVAAVREVVTVMHRLTLAGAPAAPAPSQPPEAVQAPPSEFSQDIELDGEDPELGSRNAPVAMLEFSDYECPYCGRYQTDAFAQIKKRYIDTGKLRYVYRDFPLEFHASARPAAIAAACAAAQQQFAPFSAALFARQGELGEALYTELAQRVKLDTAAFEKCRTDSARASEIDADLKDGERFGVRGTPTFFVGNNGGPTLQTPVRLVGSQPFSVFAQAIDGALAKSLRAPTSKP